jgi:chitinase
MLDRLGADGIDIDWEFPDDRDVFTALMQTLRDSLGGTREISFSAAGFSPWLQRSYDWRRLVPIVTRMNLMTYDLIGSRSRITGHHAALYSSPPQVESADHAIRYLDSLGIPHEKLAIGVALYAREFVDVPDLRHGLFQTGRFRRFLSLNRIRQLPGYNEYWDSLAQAPYSYNVEKKSFLTYDNVRSALLKAAYVRQHRLGGILFWQLELDKPRGGVVDSLYAALAGGRFNF